MIRRLLTGLVLLAFAACSSGAGEIGPQALPGVAPAAHSEAFAPNLRRHKHLKAYAQIFVPRGHHRRKAKFVSPSTQGIKIVASYNGGKQYVETTVAALGPGQPNCKPTSSGFFCKIVVIVWEGNDTITVTTYDAAPAGGTIPPSAHILGRSTVIQTVTPGSTPYISILLGGEIGSIAAGPLFASVPADGSSHDVAIAFSAKDFGGNTITAKAGDPYANPIKATLVESGGSGHAVLLLDGTPSGSSAKVRFSTDTLAVRYDGGGKAGYTIQVTLAARGASSQTAQISPLILSGPGIASHALGLNGTTVSNALSITEANAPSSQTYGLTQSGCAGIASTSGFSGSGASASFTATGGSRPSASGCSFTITDGLSTSLLLPVTNTPIGGSVNVNGVRLTAYGAPTNVGPMTLGPDNHIWFVDASVGGQLYSFTPTLTGPTISAGPVIVTLSNSYSQPSISGLTAGPGKTLWISDTNSEGIDRVTLSGSGVSYSDGSVVACPASIILASDGLFWVANNCSGLWNFNDSGGIRPSAGAASTAFAEYVVEGADGDIYIDDGTNIDKYDPVTRTSTQIAIPNGTSITGLASAPGDGASGAIWYTAWTSSTLPIGYVGRIAIGSASAVTKVTLGDGVTTGGEPSAIATGADSAVWFADSYNNKVGKISFSQPTTATSYPMPGTAVVPGPVAITPLVLGPDGALWLAAGSQIVQIIP